MTKNFRDAFREGDDESLRIFLRGMDKLNQKFCDLMASGNDYTLRFEVNGNKGKLNHVRVYMDDIERPKTVGKNKK